MKKITVASLVVLTLVTSSFAGKKALIWDDTETLGTGNYQNENYFFYKKYTDETDGSYIFNFTYGYNDKTDIALNVPFGYLKNYENAYSDISDPFVEVKYRFYEKKWIKICNKAFFRYSCKER
ncbi:hypothetical protein [Sulfurihydrogenibium azorense]|uniref:hypothetical protein n=1 Tax=Sulfurihydrogenibium azorense TaxID=309806 RepID=UPI0024094573|nr:hypothetical protein [Sulfurihydrogenibium azorense]MDM7274127.1 hypothetical protein [Sulfurihydrogenibium azorense]